MQKVFIKIERHSASTKMTKHIFSTFFSVTIPLFLSLYPVRIASFIVIVSFNSPKIGWEPWRANKSRTHRHTHTLMKTGRQKASETNRAIAQFLFNVIALMSVSLSGVDIVDLRRKRERRKTDITKKTKTRIVITQFRAQTQTCNKNEKKTMQSK